jgi:hypothetical protein
VDNKSHFVIINKTAAAAGRSSADTRANDDIA